MSRAKSVEIIKDESSDLEARIVAAIGKAGPRNVAQIARMTGAHQETIRYKIKKRFGRLGFHFHAEVDFDKLGLGLHWATLSFSRTHNNIAPQLLRALNRVGYLTYFAKLVPQGNFIALLALPQNTAKAYAGFLERLKTKRILEGFTLDPVLVSRHKAMDPRLFDFRSGKWEMEWDGLADQPAAPLQLGNKPRIERFDYYDLLVIKELQKDSLQHLTGIAKKLKIHQKTLEYHYRTHVQKWKLVPSYRIEWTRDTPKRPTHSTITTRFAFHGLTKSEFTAVQGAISKVPFLWLEDLLQNGEYIATLHTPVAEMLSTTSYISAAAPGLASKVEMSYIKSNESTSFTIPYNMYQDGNWKFNLRQMEATLQRESVTPLEK